MLLDAEQLIAPRDSRPQRLVPRQGGLAAAGEQSKAITQPRSNLLDGEDLHPHGGQFERQRYAVQAAADLGDALRVGCIDAELRIDPPGAIHEQPHGLGGRDRLVIGRRRRRHGERPQRDHLLPGNAQALAAGHDEPQFGARRQQCLCDLRRGPDHVLAVVEHDQHAPLADMLRDPAGKWRARRLADSECRRDGQRQTVGVLQRCQVHEPHAIGIGRQQVLGELECEARLAATADSRERQEPGFAKQPRALGALALAADEVRALARQVVRRRRLGIGRRGGRGSPGRGHGQRLGE